MRQQRNKSTHASVIAGIRLQLFLSFLPLKLCFLSIHYTLVSISSEHEWRRSTSLAGAPGRVISRFI
ncbi:hypothetical protein CW354_14250 [Marinicaulis flavus]|uniref:Uncharacterized protein n=1 Tax=Hyphococcus luteus TaxID=2058213 RepID=A0A2S7K3X5_9PROT|nr:hypothetical protein CW354_14250 [Marinicaulis flavus]